MNPAMSPPAVNALSPAPVITIARTPLVVAELGEHGRELLAGGHRDAVHLLRARRA